MAGGEATHAVGPGGGPWRWHSGLDRARSLPDLVYGLRLPVGDINCTISHTELCVILIEVATVPFCAGYSPSTVGNEIAFEAMTAIESAELTGLDPDAYLADTHPLRHSRLPAFTFSKGTSRTIVARQDAVAAERVSTAA